MNYSNIVLAISLILFVGLASCGESVDGVKAVEVSLENGIAEVLCAQDVTPEQLIQAVEEAGYGAKLSEQESP